MEQSTQLILLILALGVFYSYLRLSLPKSTPSSELQIYANEITPIFDRLNEQNENKNFAVLHFKPQGNNNIIYIQLSIENEKIGLDWLLAEKGNLNDKDTFLNISKTLSHTPIAKKTENIEYFRCEGGNLKKLLEALVFEHYKIQPDETLTAIIEPRNWYTSQEGKPPTLTPPPSTILKALLSTLTAGTVFLFFFYTSMKTLIFIRSTLEPHLNNTDWLAPVIIAASIGSSYTGVWFIQFLIKTLARKT